MAEKSGFKGIFRIDYKENKKQTEKVFPGILGALLFSLGGVAVWLLLWYAGFVSGLAGIIMLILAANGYIAFGKKLTKRGLIIAIIVTLIMITVSWMLSITIDVLRAFREGYEAGEVAMMPTFVQAFAFGMLTIFTDSSMLGSYLFELVVGLALTALTAVMCLRPLFKKLKEAEQQPDEQPTAEQAEVNEPSGYAYEETHTLDGGPGYAVIGASIAEEAAEKAEAAAAEVAEDIIKKSDDSISRDNTITQTEE